MDLIKAIEEGQKRAFTTQFKVGDTVKVYFKIIEGKTERIYFDTLERICKVLECTPNDIIVSDDPQLKRLLAYQSKLSELINKSDTK